MSTHEKQLLELVYQLEDKIEAGKNVKENTKKLQELLKTELYVTVYDETQDIAIDSYTLEDLYNTL